MRGRAVMVAASPSCTTAAVLDDDQPVGEHQGVERVVGDQQRGAGVLGEVAVQLGAGVQPGAGVQRGERFVEQQQRGVDGQRAGQRDPLGLPAGQLPGFAAGVLGQADPVEPAGGLFAGGRAGRRRGGAGPNATLSSALRCGNSR